MALQAQIWPQPSVRIEKVLEVIAEVGQPLDGTMLNSSTIMTDTPDLSQASPLEEAEVSTSLAATCAKQKASWCLTVYRMLYLPVYVLCQTLYSMN